MGLGLSLSLSPRLQLKQALRLTLGQRIEIANRLLAMRLSLISHLAGVNYEPLPKCPACKYHLTLLETLQGYNSDPTDLTTGCPKCKSRFVAQLRSGSAELQWYCPSQTQYALREFAHLPPEEILRLNPSLYHSAISHFGTVTAAFADDGITYAHKEETLWHSKVQPFLGKLPDAIIGEIVGVSSREITKLRRAFGIAGFKRSRTLDIDPETVLA